MTTKLTQKIEMSKKVV